MKTKYHVGHLFGAAIVGSLCTGLFMKSNQAVEETPKTNITQVREIRETPTLSIIQDESPYQTYTQVDFFDRDLDRNTVERFVVTEYSDAGSAVSSKVLIDLEREDMSEHRASLIDGRYQRCLSGDFNHSESLIVNRLQDNSK